MSTHWLAVTEELVISVVNSLSAACVASENVIPSRFCIRGMNPVKPTHALIGLNLAYIGLRLHGVANCVHSVVISARAKI